MKKRLIGIMLAAMLGMALCAGCGGKSSDAGQMDGAGKEYEQETGDRKSVV